MIKQVDIHAALMARLETMFFGLDAPTIVYPGKPAAKAKYWVRVTHLPNVPDRIAMDAATPYVHRGILQIDMMNELGRHEVVYLDRAEAVIEHFPANLRMTSGTAAVTVQRSYSLGGRSTGDHWMIPVRVEYIVGSA